MFPAFLMPMLIGAGTGALGGLLTGKDPLKGALVGGVTGGLLGSVPALGAGGVGAGAASASSAGATGLVGAGNATLGSGIGAGFGGGVGGAGGSYVAGGDPSLFVAGQPVQQTGAFNSFNFGTNEPLNVASSATPTTGSIMGEQGGANLTGAGISPNMTSMQDFARSQLYGTNNAMLNDPVLGGINPLSSFDYEKIAAMPAESSSFFGDIYDKVSPYVNLRDLTGVAQVASQYQDRPMPTPQSGRITEGRAPQANDVMALLQTMKLPDRRRITLI